MGRCALGLAGVSILAIAFACAGGGARAEDGAIDEIVVTARRQAENLQDVPQTVVPVTGQTLQDLQINKVQDIQALVPGLSLTNTPSMFYTLTMRGVTYNIRTNGSPTIALYLNDAPIPPLFLLQAQYDTQQIEVLRGPQGTTRGVSAPSGAITMTTHRPNLSSFGGYVDGALTNRSGRVAEGAINVPIIPDVLGVRIAGVYQYDRAQGYRSIHSSAKPFVETAAARISLRFNPNDALDANLVYQHLDRKQQAWLAVSGIGDNNAINPPISPSQRLSVLDNPSFGDNQYDIVTAQLDSRLFGHEFSYVGSWSNGKSDLDNQYDDANVLPGFDYVATQNNSTETTTHEFRISSPSSESRFIDYTVGAFYSWYDQGGLSVNSAQFLPGAFGGGATPNLAAFNPRYWVRVNIAVPVIAQETSVFGGVNLHLGPKTELSAGVRHIWSVFKAGARLETTPAFIALPPAALRLPSCVIPGLVNFPSTYPGLCDVAVPPRLVSDGAFRVSETPTIYNVSLSHHFTSNLMAYATTGTAYLRPTSTIGLQGPFAESSNPLIRTLAFHPSQRSTNYEIGLKWTFLEGRGRLNVAAFRQTYRDFQILTADVNYRNLSTTPPSIGSFQFPTTVDAKVTGFDVDAELRITPEWLVHLQASYSNDKISGSLVPCNLFNASGQPVFNTENMVSFCPGTHASRTPKWNASLHSVYERPITERMNGFIRALASYYPKNNRAGANYSVKSYSIVNLYAGVRSRDGAWEASIFARNAFDDDTLIERSDLPIVPNGLSQFPTLNRTTTGYYSTDVTPKREIGVNIRYAFGSR